LNRTKNQGFTLPPEDNKLNAFCCQKTQLLASKAAPTARSRITIPTRIGKEVCANRDNTTPAAIMSRRRTKKAGLKNCQILGFFKLEMRIKLFLQLLENRNSPLTPPSKSPDMAATHGHTGPGKRETDPARSFPPLTSRITPPRHHTKAARIFSNLA